MNVNTGRIVDLGNMDKSLAKQGYIAISAEEKRALLGMGLEERLEHMERTRPDGVAAARSACGTKCPSIKSRFKRRVAR